MIEAAENVAKNITSVEMNKMTFAYRSHQLASKT